MIKKVVTLFVLYWILGLIGCWNCPEIQGNYFDITGLQIKEYKSANNRIDLLGEGEKVDFK